jgi:uncharacterized protein involved in oxidation of intracellular sulfur
VPTTLFILNDSPYGSERSYNALRLAGSLAARPDEKVRLFLMGDAVACAKTGQKVPEGYYNVQVMVGKVLRSGEAGVCGTCLDARGIGDGELMTGAPRSSMKQLADWVASSDHVLSF